VRLLCATGEAAAVLREASLLGGPKEGLGRPLTGVRSLCNRNVEVSRVILIGDNCSRDVSNGDETGDTAGAHALVAGLVPLVHSDKVQRTDVLGLCITATVVGSKADCGTLVGTATPTCTVSPDCLGGDLGVDTCRWT